MASLLPWILMGIISSIGFVKGSDSEEILNHLGELTNLVSKQKTDLISKFGEIKEELTQEVRDMINDTVTEMQSVNSDVAELTVLLDRDECSDFTHNCSSDAACTDTRTSFRCKCKPGFKGDGYTCEDVDECSDEVCDPTATCINTMGSYRCDCREGFQKADNGTCEDIDECAKDNGGCHKYAACENTPGSYNCSCAYFSEGDGQDCKAKEKLSCTEPFMSVRGIGCIYIHKQDQDFYDSRADCKQKGGDLFVAINTKHYFRLAQYFLDNGQADIKKYMWVGVKEGVWLSGRKVDPAEEAPGNPSMKSGTCSYTDGDTGEKFLLWTHPCSYDWYALCEQKP